MAFIELKGVVEVEDADVREFVRSVTSGCLLIRFDQDPFPPYICMKSGTGHRSRLALLEFETVSEAIKAKKAIDSVIMEEMLQGPEESFAGEFATYFVSAAALNRSDDDSSKIILKGFARDIGPIMLQNFVSTISACPVKCVSISRSGLAFVDMHSNKDALHARVEIGIAILNDPTKCQDMLQSDSLQVRLKEASASCRNDLTLVLSRLSSSASDQDIIKLINDCRVEDLQRIKLTKCNALKLAFLFFHSSEKTLLAKIKIETALLTGAASFMSSQQSEVRLSIVRTEDALQQDAQDLLKSLSATTHIEQLFQSMGVKCGTDLSRKYGILKGGTGTGKTIGTAILSALLGRNVIIVVPKVVQVQMLVDFLKTVKFPQTTRSGIRKEVVVGYSAGRDTQYNIGEHTIIVVTYGHFLRSAVAKMARSPSKTAFFSDYLVVLDEVHESQEHIQAVLCLSHRIKNQQIITSATMDEVLMKRTIGERIFSCSVREEIRQAMYEVKIDYVPMESIRCQQKFIEMVCKITKENLALCSETEKILIFVPGTKYIDSIRFALHNQKILDKSESGAAHSELWDDEILDVVKCKRVIVATSILESSVTVEGLKVVIDTLLKNEMVNDFELEEGRISKAEAIQRAGRVGRLDRGQGRPDKVVRLMSKEAFENLPPFPRPPFQSRLPCEVFLLLSSVFDFSMPVASKSSNDSESEEETDAPSSKIGKVLHLSDGNCRKCINELQNLTLLGENSITEFGRLVLRVGMSLKFACTVVKVFQDRSSRCNDDIRLFVLLTAVAFENMGSYVFYLPLEKRMSSFQKKFDYVKDDEYPGRHFLGTCAIETVANIMLEAIFHPGNIVSNTIIVPMVRDWCFSSSINSKYVVTVLRHFVLLSGDLFGMFSKPSFSCIKELQSMQTLRNVFSTIAVNEQNLIDVDTIIASGMWYFRQFFLRRYILETNEPNGLPSYSCTASAGDDCSMRNIANVVFLERISFKPTFPKFAGCISMIRIKSDFNDQQKSDRLQITGLFPIILDLDAMSEEENLSQQQKSNTALMLGFMAAQQRASTRSLRTPALTFLKGAVLELRDPTNALYALMSFAQHDDESKSIIVQSGAASALKDAIILHQTKTTVTFAYAYAYEALRYLQDTDPSIFTFLASNVTEERVQAINRLLNRNESARGADALKEGYQPSQVDFPILSKKDPENASSYDRPLNFVESVDKPVFTALVSATATTIDGDLRPASEQFTTDMAKSPQQTDVDQKLEGSPNTGLSIERLVELLHFGHEADKEYALKHLILESGNNEKKRIIVKFNAIPQLCTLSKSDDSELRQKAEELLGILSSGDKQTQTDLLLSGVIKPFVTWVHADFLVDCIQSGHMALIQNASKVLEFLAHLDVPVSFKDPGRTELVFVLLKSVGYIQDSLCMKQTCSEEDSDRIFRTLCRFSEKDCFQRILVESGNIRILSNILISKNETLLRKKRTLEIFQHLAAGNEELRQELTRQLVVPDLVGIFHLHFDDLYGPAIKCLNNLSLGSDNVKQEIVEKGGVQHIVGILCLKSATREIHSCAVNTIQNLAVGDEITKKGLLYCECIPPILGMLSDSFESNFRRAHALGFLVLMCKKIKDQRMKLTTRILSDTAEALAKIAQKGTQKLRSSALEVLWILSAVNENMSEILIRAESIEPATWFSIYGAGQEKENARSLLGALVGDKNTCLPDPDLMALSDSMPDLLQREHTVLYLLGMLLIDGSSSASEYAVSVLELITRLEPYRETVTRKGGIRALVAKFDFEYALNAFTRKREIRLVIKALQNLVEGSDTVKLALIELNAFMPLKMLLDETNESNSIEHLKTHVAYALDIGCCNLRLKQNIVNFSMESKLFNGVLKMARTGTDIQRKAAQCAVLRLSLGHDEGLRKQIIKAGVMPILVDSWRNDIDCHGASAESAAGAVLDLIHGLNDLENELIRAGVLEAVHETLKNHISSSKLVEFATGIFVYLSRCQQSAQLIKAQPSLVSILVNIASQPTNMSAHHAIRALGQLADSGREMEVVLLRAGAVKPLIYYFKNTRQDSRRVDLKPLLMNAFKKFAAYDADTQKALLDASILEPFVFLAREGPGRLEHQSYVNVLCALEVASQNGSSHMLVCEALHSIVLAFPNYAPASFGILKNLACGSVDTKRLLIASGVFEPFVKMINDEVIEDKTTEHVLDLLNLASKDTCYCLKLILAGVLQPLLRVLAAAPTRDVSGTTVSRKAILILKNLAAGCTKSKKSLAEAGAINTLMRFALESTHEVEMLASSALISLAQGDESTQDLLLLAGAVSVIAAKCDQLGSDHKGNSLCSLLHLSLYRDKTKMMESVLFKLLVETVQSPNGPDSHKRDAIRVLNNISEGDNAIKTWLVHMGILNALIWVNTYGDSGMRKSAAEIMKNLSVIFKFPTDLLFEEMAAQTIVIMAQDESNISVQKNGLSALKTILLGNEEAKRLILKHCPVHVIVSIGRKCKEPLIEHIVKSMEMIALSEGSTQSLDISGGTDWLVSLLSRGQDQQRHIAAKALRSLSSLGRSSRAALVLRGAVHALMLHISCSSLDLKTAVIDALHALASGGEEEEEVCRALTNHGAIEVLLNNGGFALDKGSVQALVLECSSSSGQAGAQSNKAAAAIAAAVIAASDSKQLGDGGVVEASTVKEFLKAGAVEALVGQLRQRSALAEREVDGGDDAAQALAALLMDAVYGSDASERALTAGIAGALGPLIVEARYCSCNDRRMLAQGALEALLSAHAAGQGLTPLSPGVKAVLHSVTNGTQPEVKHAAQALSAILQLSPSSGVESWQRVTDRHSSFVLPLKKGSKGRSKR